MRVIPRRHVGVLVAIAVVAVLAAPKLLELRRSSAAVSTAPSKEILRIKVHRVVPSQLAERLATQEMVGHRFLDSSRRTQQSVYEDGTTVTVDFETKEYTIEYP